MWRVAEAAAVDAPMAGNSGLPWRSIAVAVLMVVVVPRMATPAAALHQELNNSPNQDKPEPNLICKLLALSVSIVDKAGDIVREILRSNTLNTVIKGENDYQTKADVNAQKCIVTSIKHLFPDVMVIAEESDNDYLMRETQFDESWLVNTYDQDVLSRKCPAEYDNVQSHEIVIWVDPLDATSSYAYGQPSNVTILIGICFKGNPVAGVINQPFWEKENGVATGRTLWGIVGGSYGGFELKIMQKKPDEKYKFVTCRNTSSSAIEVFLTALHPNELIRAAGAGNKVLYLLEGKAHAYVYPNNGTRRWDTAGPEAILRAVGGDFTNVEGRHYYYFAAHGDEAKNNLGIFATAPGVDHAAFIRYIHTIVKITKDDPKLQKFFD